MVKDQAKLIKKLRLKKGCKYILFIPEDCLDIEEAINLSEMLFEIGFSDSFIVHVMTSKGIKVIEQEK